MNEITLDDVEVVYGTMGKYIMILKNGTSLEVLEEKRYYIIENGKKIYLNEDIKKLIEFGRLRWVKKRRYLKDNYLYLYGK